MLAVPLAHAQDDATDEVVKPRRYTVEVIVFTYAENVSVGTEIFPPDAPPAPDETVLADEFNASRDGVEIDADGEPIPSFGDTDVADPRDDEKSGPSLFDIEPVLMIDDDFSLQRTLEQLQRLDVYEPILHTGWTQTTLPLEASIPLELPYFGQPPAGLAGSFTLYLGRYLHLVVDLTLDAPGEMQPQSEEFGESILNFDDARLDYDNEAVPRDGTVRYRIQEDRIVKNGDIRYFDHPKFGVIAKVTRVEESAEESEADGSLVASPVQ